MKTVVTITMNPSLDLSTGVEEIIPERKLRTTALRREAGGGGINVARGIRILGGKATVLYTCGGPTGKMLTELMDHEGLVHIPLPIQAPTRESFAILERSSSNLFHFVSPGPKLNLQEWQQCLDKINQFKPKPDYLVASGSLPPGVPDDFYAQMAHIAKKRTIRMILDTSGEALRAALKEGVYLIKPNKYEFRDLMGYRSKTQEKQASLSREIIKQGGAEVVLLTLGSRGALLTTGDKQFHLFAPAVKPVSPIGAGDSLIAALTFKLASGRPLKEALYYGVAAGTAALLTPGTELYRREDLASLYQQLRNKQSLPHKP